MFRSAVLVFFLLLFLQVPAQRPNHGRLTVGVEQDLLPYATGGYFAGFWAGQGHFRVRALTARVHKPDFVLKNGFTNNRVTAYALTADSFLSGGWSGWWAGAGPVFWKSSIQEKHKAAVYHYRNLLLNGSVGYSYVLGRKWYISPWAGMHIRVAGPAKVQTAGGGFKPPLLNPEASVKLGVFF